MPSARECGRATVALVTEERIAVEVESSSVLARAALTHELDAAGFEATGEPPVERRGVGVEVGRIAVHVLEGAIGDEVLRRLIAAIRAGATRLRDSHHPPDGVTVPIYGPRGEVIAEVTVPPSD